MHQAVMLLMALTGGTEARAARADPAVCGRNSLGLIVAYHQIKGAANALDNALPDSRAPFSFAELDAAARWFGLEAHLVRWGKKDGATFDCPAVVRVRRRPGAAAPDHFVACFGRSNDGATVLLQDFPGALIRVPWTRFAETWEGEALYVEPLPAASIAALQHAEHSRAVLRMVGCGLAIAALTAALVLRRRRSRARNQEPVGMRYDRGARPGPRWRRPWAVISAVLFMGAMAVYHFGKSTSSELTLVADRDLKLVQVTDDDGPSRRIVFRLTNTTDKALTITNATSTCTCVVVKPVDGMLIAPHQSMNLELDVALAKLGAVTRYVRVYHDAATDPLVLRIGVQGNRALPFVASKVNNMPVFASLHERGPPQTVGVETREKTGSSAWLARLECDLDEVDVQSLGMSETVGETPDVVKRMYRWSVAWRKLSDASELSGRLSLVATNHHTTRMELGRLTARLLQDGDYFSPSTVYLESNGREHDIAVSKDKVGLSEWTVASGFVLPPWLQMTATRVADRQAFEFRLSPQQAPRGQQSVLVPFEDPAGEKTVVRIVANLRD